MVNLRRWSNREVMLGFHEEGNQRMSIYTNSKPCLYYDMSWSQSAMSWTAISTVDVMMGSIKNEMSWQHQSNKQPQQNNSKTLYKGYYFKGGEGELWTNALDQAAQIKAVIMNLVFILPKWNLFHEIYQIEWSMFTCKQTRPYYLSQGQILWHTVTEHSPQLHQNSGTNFH